MSSSDYSAPGRACEGCTACCEGWLKTEVDGCEVGPGTPCKHLGENGCQIYPTRPKDPCMTFVCGWMMNPDLPDWIKPNKSKVILKPHYVWERPSSKIDVLLAYAVGPRIPGKSKHWLKGYATENNCNILCNEPIREGKAYTGEMLTFGIGSPSFETEVRAWASQGHEFYIARSSAQLIRVKQVGR